MSVFRRAYRLPRARGILWATAATLAVLLFMGGPGYHSPRSHGAAWNMGHILAFSLWSYLLVTWRPVERASPVIQWGVVFLFCLVGGGATEEVQHLLGADASLGDVGRDVLGGTITLAWFAPSSRSVSKRVRTTARGITAAFLFVASLPLGVALYDEGTARAQFPILSDFETPFERARWDKSSHSSVDRSVARHGYASLRVDMDTGLYSGASLVYFPRNWAGFRSLRMSIFNPSTEEIRITCRIHDRVHERGEQRYEDRFNRSFPIRNGWNDLRIDLEDVAEAPAGRRMDLGEVRLVGLFASRLRAPRSIFVDHVRLE